MTARDAIAQAGGLCTASELAIRWGITPQWARHLLQLEGFPEPILTAHGARSLWLADEADAAFAAYDASLPGRRIGSRNH